MDFFYLYAIIAAGFTIIGFCAGIVFEKTNKISKIIQGGEK